MKKHTSIIVTVLLTAITACVIALILIQHTIGLDSVFGGSSSQSAMPGSFGSGGFPGMPGGGSSSSSAINIEAETVAPQLFVKTISINGNLEREVSEKNIVSDISGKVVEVRVQRGDVVRAGDVIAVVDPSQPGSQYKTREITAQVGGTIMSVDAYVGQSVNSNTTLATVGNPSQLILVLDVPEKYLSLISVGSEATFTTAAWPEQEYHATISYIGTSVSTSTRTVECQLAINDIDGKLLEGMYVKCSLVIEKLDDVFLAPTKALSTYLGNDILYIVDSSNGRSTAKRVNVVTGSSNDTYTVIESGLEAGDVLVTVGTVTDGSSVNIIN